MSDSPTLAAPVQNSASFFKTRWHQLPTTAIRAVFVLLLWPMLMVLPGSTDASLDGSWHEVLLYAHLKGWQFGRDIVFTWGPWGFLNNQFHLGAAGAGIKILWETLGKLGIAIALVVLTRRMPVAWQTLFMLSCVLFTWLFLDTIFLVLITLMVVGGLLQIDTPRWQQILWVIALAFLAQIKFTYLLFAVAGIGSAFLLYVFRKDYAVALRLGTGFVLAFLIFWMCAGQNPVNIPAYILSSLEFSAGYGWAMGFDEKSTVFLSCASLALACAFFVYEVWKKSADRAFAWTAGPFLASTWFVVWKHGLVRADGHERGFIAYSLLIALALPALCFPGRKWHWFPLAAILGVVCLQISQPGLVAGCPAEVQSRVRQHYAVLFRVGTLPSQWQDQFNQAARQNDLPAIKQMVGAKSVDVFNYDQGIALLNNLNYTPRPIFQSYSAYTPSLMLRNWNFYQSGSAPEYILWRHGSIDGRYPTNDDALLAVELPRTYKPVLEEGGYLLLEKHPGPPPAPLERKPLLKRSLRLGEVLNLPDTGATPLWFQATFKLSKLGKLRAFLYKPPSLQLIVVDETGRETRWRMQPKTAKEGFLLSPLLETQSDFAAFFRGQGSQRIRSLRLAAWSKQKEFWPHDRKCAEIHIYTLPALSLDKGNKGPGVLGDLSSVPIRENARFDLPPELTGLQESLMANLRFKADASFP